MFLNLIAGHIAFAVITKGDMKPLSCLIMNVLFSTSQQQLNQIKTWKEKVLSMTKSFCTENGIFFVDCHAVQQKLLPQLNSIFKQMVQMVALDVVRLSHEMVTDVDKLSQVKTRQLLKVQCKQAHHSEEHNFVILVFKWKYMYDI